MFLEEVLIVLLGHCAIVLVKFGLRVFLGEERVLFQATKPSQRRAGQV